MCLPCRRSLSRRERAHLWPLSWLLLSRLMLLMPLLVLLLSQLLSWQ
jgi:hypothetical protein